MVELPACKRTRELLRIDAREERLYAGGYSDATLDAWADRLAAWDADGQDSYVYFDNDIDGRAPWDAERLIERVGN